MAPTAPLEQLNKVIGALMLGTFVNSMLYMLEILEVIKYYKGFPKDSKTIKACIFTLVLLDTTCTFAEWACIYLYGVLHWGDLSYLGYQNLVIPIYIYTSGIIGFIVQNFLISRYYKLTNRRAVCATLVLMSTAAEVGSVWCATQLSVVTDYTHRNVAVHSAILWLVSSAATDISIAAALVLQLHSVTSAFRETRSLIRRLIFHTIQTGSFTTAIAICVLVTYLTDTNANICVGFGFTLGRLYTLTMLFNLNNRRITKDGGESGSARNNNTPTGADISLHGITVHRTAIVHIDDEQAPSQHEMDDKRTPDYGPFNDYAKSHSDETVVVKNEN
ncbi:hypothetical protein B0H17DRAFT_1174192 [Mycena rosella]|uniref:DUF6534 domain-containing protein n=1 Tax=Mycena rosella TaxID=1033263 RepID=A0AAD7GZM0_MYCRO|nr:hypothetical protein B0H17DRAFT_1174192 [Mycena rosella]